MKKNSSSGAGSFDSVLATIQTLNTFISKNTELFENSPKSSGASLTVSAEEIEQMPREELERSCLALRSAVDDLEKKLKEKEKLKIPVSKTAVPTSLEVCFPHS
jgi:hypothetical protein